MQIETRHILICLVVFGFLSRDDSTLQLEKVNGIIRWRTKPIFAALVFVPILLMTVFGKVRGDVNAYLRIFYNIPTELSSAIHYLLTSSMEAGFSVFNIVLKLLFGPDETVFRLAVSLAQAVPLVLILRKYSEDYVYSIFLFIALNLHGSWMMNGVRQFMAVTIIFAATPYFMERNNVVSIIVILIAALFHKTALFMIPVIFIIRGKVWNDKTIIFSILIVFATLLFARSGDAFDSISGSMGYSLSYSKEAGDDGTNPLRVMVHALPMILAFVFRKKLETDHNPMINMCVNMSVITTGIYLVSMVTSGIMVGRMPIYTSLYNLILMPYIIHRCFTEELKKAAFFGFIVFYILFLYVSTGGI